MRTMMLLVLGAAVCALATADEATISDSVCADLDAESADSVQADIDAQSEGTVAMVEGWREEQSAMFEEWFMMTMGGEEVDMEGDDAVDYASMTTAWIAPGVIAMVFLGLVPCTCVARCCCKCATSGCCSCIPCCFCCPCCKRLKREEQTCCAKMCSNGSFFLFALTTICLCGAGSAAFGNIANGMLTTGCAMEELADESSAFINGINEPFQEIAGTSLDIIDEVNATIATLSDLGADLTNVVTTTTDFVTWAKGLEIKVCDECDPINPLSTYPTEDLTEDIQATGDAVVETLLQVKSDTIQSLTEPKDMIVSLSESANSVVNMTTTFIEDFRNDFVYTQIDVSDVNPQARQVFLSEDSYSSFSALLSDAKKKVKTFGSIFFSFIFIGLVFMILGNMLMNVGFGVCIGKWLSRFSGCFFLTIGLYICLLISTVFTVVGMIGSDTCVILGKIPMEGQLDTYFYNSTFFPADSNSTSTNPLAVLDACFQDTNLLEALNMTGVFDPLTGDDGLANKFNTLDFDLSDSLDFNKDGSVFATFKDDITSFTREDFGFSASNLALIATTCDDCTGFVASAEAAGVTDATVLTGAQACDDYAAAIAATMGVATAAATVCADANDGIPDLVNLKTACTEAQTNMCTAETTMEEAGQAIDTAIGQIQTNFSKIDDAIQILTTNSLTFQDEFFGIANMTKPITDNVEILIENARCGFVGDVYMQVDDGICTQMLSGLLNVALCMLLASYFSIVTLIAVMGQEVTLAGVAYDDDGDSGGGAEQGVEVTQMPSDLKG